MPTQTAVPVLSDAELIDALYRIPEHGKAEIVEGAIVRMSPTGARPGRTATKIVSSLLHHEELFGGGTAFGDNIGFLVYLPKRRSFSPDAGIIRACFVSAPEVCVVFARGMVADAELAVPGWRLPADSLFDLPPASSPVIP